MIVVVKIMVYGGIVISDDEYVRSPLCSPSWICVLSAHQPKRDPGRHDNNDQGHVHLQKYMKEHVQNTLNTLKLQLLNIS